MNDLTGKIIKKYLIADGEQMSYIQIMNKLIEMKEEARLELQSKNGISVENSNLPALVPQHISRKQKTKILTLVDFRNKRVIFILPEKKRGNILSLQISPQKITSVSLWPFPLSRSYDRKIDGGEK